MELTNSTLKTARSKAVGKTEGHQEVTTLAPNTSLNVYAVVSGIMKFLLFIINQ